MTHPTRVTINRGCIRKGRNTLPPEIEIWLDAMDIAISDIKEDNGDRAESERWLLSKHAFWLGSLIYGDDSMRVFQNWVRDEMPPPEEARKRRQVYNIAGKEF